MKTYCRSGHSNVRGLATGLITERTVFMVAEPHIAAETMKDVFAGQRSDPLASFIFLLTNKTLCRFGFWKC